MECREALSHQGKNVHLIPRHSPGTCKIPPERGCLLVQGAASLQRFASGSDAASGPSISLPGISPDILMAAAIHEQPSDYAISGYAYVRAF